MFNRIAQLLGFSKKDDALAARFARMRKRYGVEPEASADVLGVMRTGLNMRSVTGAQKTTAEQMRKQLIESYARSAEIEIEPALK